MDAPQENSACRERAGGTGLQCSTFKADASIVEYRYEWLLQPPGLVSNGDSSGQPSTCLKRCYAEVKRVQLKKSVPKPDDVEKALRN